MNSSKLEKQRRALKNKKRWTKFWFVAFSAAIWLVIKLSATGYTQTINYQINLKSNSPQVVVVNPKINVTLEVVANGFGLLSTNLNLNQEIYMNVDFDNANQKEVFLNLTEKKPFLEKELGNDLKIVDIYPSSVKLKVDVLKNKLVKVIPKYTLKLPPTYNLYNAIEMHPNQVEVYAPAAILDTLHYIYTQNFVIKSEQKEQEILTNLKVPKLANVSVTPNAAKAKISVKAYTQKTLQIPIQSINQPAGAEVKLFPAFITLKCNVAVADYDRITPEKFICLADLNQAKEGNKRIGLELNTIPKNTKVISWGDKSVEYLMID